ncbi:Cytochrome P450 2J6 [Hypsibius exemplaris]|uniref:Cytochrome P450 2J6 n=1 Tax=Hypsibius exemplaris TaxID=2072580 RepID=A0A9X6NGA1_HYPEX|nr:Cytochrome P450 2J6 [Hypsibius exemplaris]
MAFDNATVTGSIVLLLLSTLGYWLYRRKVARRKLPPGPPCLPFVGTLLSADLNDFVGTFATWAKRYGSVFTSQLGPFTAIVLNDPAVIKEAFSKEVFIPRPQFWSIDQRRILNNNTRGIVFADGETWKEHRRFILQTFRDFGVGKSGMEEKIVEETRHFIRALRASQSRPLDNKVPLSTTVANVIAKILSGARYEETDPIFLQYLADVSETFSVSLDKIILDVFPWAKYFPTLNGTKTKLFATQRRLKEFMQAICEDHRKNWVPGKNEDLLDTYLTAIQSGQYKSFSTTEIPLILEDLFEAGYETTTTTLRWGFLMMCLNPEVQAKVQKELDDVVGRDVIPKPSDKYHLPYFEATLQEVHRFGSIVPLGVDHCAAEDTTFAGYSIPKGAWLTANLRFIHHNDAWWDQPDKFDPSRFLGPEGERRAAEYLIPFSVGKRRCVGEALAKAELYTIFAGVLQNFSLQLPPGVTASSVSLLPTTGITADTKPHEICYIPRGK